MRDKEIRCTKNLITSTRRITLSCYSAALLPIYNAQVKAGNFDGSVIEFKESEQWPIWRDEVDNQYRKNLCKLSTKAIESIILCHVKGQIMRAKITLEVLYNEIANRAILGDSSRGKQQLT